ncbi:MAG: tetraacyldisaccharide 4'-kinase [Aureispira sp.]|nr:tetraacyldisaccharide 4'-kinase [Aureispira sp.]
MKIIRYLLVPVSLIYGFVVELIKWFYQIGIRKIHYSKIPIINIGNLSTGGTGKSPHVSYLIELLSAKLNIAILSRGYNRKTKGVLWVEQDALAQDTGDEPLQFKKEFPSVPVIVSEKRALALPHIQERYPNTELILLDDAFQHWALYSPINILLTTFDQPFFEDFVLPTGNLREFRKGYQRADIIIITKCPSSINTTQKSRFQKAIPLKEHQKIFFSYYEYVQPKVIGECKVLSFEELKGMNVLMLVGIADTSYLEHFMNENAKSCEWLKFPDHHYFSEKDMDAMLEHYKRLKEQKGPTVVLTTGKDAMRLGIYQQKLRACKLPIYSLPIEVKFAFGEEKKFEEAIEALLKKEKAIL